jgi:glutathione S-transferase
VLTLYDYLPSQNGRKVRVLLGLLQISYHSRLVSIFEGESRSEVFLNLNPAGAIPLLEIEDGRTIAESNAILAYLAEGTPFLPTDRYQRAKVMQWLFFEQYNVEPVIGSLRFWTLTGRLERNTSMVAAKAIPSIRTALTHTPEREQHLQWVAAGPPATARRPSTACQISNTGAPTAMSRALFNSDTARPNSAPTPNSGARRA